MKSLILAVFVIVACTAVSFADDEKYSSKYDNIDIDKILANDRLITNYIACVDGTGKCTADGEELKKHAKEATENCCEKCTDKQKETIKKVYKYLAENKADLLKELREKYDPKGEYEAKCKGKFNIAED